MRSSLRRSYALVGVALLTLEAGCAGSALLAEPLAYRAPLPLKQATRPIDRIDATPRRLAVHDRRLFLATTGGGLVALRTDDGGVERVTLGERVMDVHRTKDDHVWALTMADDSGDVRVWERERDEWVPIFEMMGTDEPLALGELRGHPLIVTRSALFWTTRDRVESLRLDDSLETDGASRVSVAATSGGVYVGVDRGAGGGELVHAELEKRSSTLVVRTDGLEGCSGTFDPSCDGVSGLEVHPGSARCVLVGVRRNETPASGRLLRVCGDAVERERGLFDAGGVSDAAPVSAQPSWTDALDPPLDLPEAGDVRGPSPLCRIDPEPCATFLAGSLDDAPDPEILALASDARGVWISSPKALVHWSTDGRVESLVPAFTELGHERVLTRTDVVGVALDRWLPGSTAGAALLATPAFVTSVMP
jgi:hypothetical protein